MTKSKKKSIPSKKSTKNTIKKTNKVKSTKLDDKSLHDLVILTKSELSKITNNLFLIIRNIDKYDVSKIQQTPKFLQYASLLHYLSDIGNGLEIIIRKEA